MNAPPAKPLPPKPFILVLMPFAKKFDDVYKVGIKAAAEAAGARCERIDEQKFFGSILNRIYSQTAAADIIIADMTGKNPNVYYETGYAHALGKPVILITRDKEIPFDLKHFQHVVYGKSISNLKAELEDKIRWSIQHPELLAPEEESNVPNLLGRWLSTWTVEQDGKPVGKKEFFYIERQRGKHVEGRVVSQESELDYCECKLEGTFSAEYLLLQWSPTGRSKEVIDYGCYVLRRQPDGSYRGFAVGQFWQIGRLSTYEHVIVRLKDEEK